MHAQAAVDAGEAHENVFLSESLYARFDIPFIMDDLLEHLQQRGMDTSQINSTHVLFSDNDVMFVRDFDASIIPPTPIVAVGPQQKHHTSLNAGVLYMNAEGCRQEFPAMFDWWANQTHWHSQLTQPMLLRFFRKRMSLLPDAFNYKAYWGPSPEATLIHFHGPKPTRCLPCYLEFRKNGTDFRKPCGCAPDYNQLWQTALMSDNGSYFAQIQEDWQAFSAALL